jgi:hypothetical protein
MAYSDRGKSIGAAGVAFAREQIVDAEDIENA